MRRRALASFVVFWFIIPRAQAQDAAAADSALPVPTFVARFRYEPLGAPRHPALAPGGRLGPRVPPAMLAAEWERAVLAAAPGLGRAHAEQPIARAPAGGIVAAQPAPAAPPEGGGGPPEQYAQLGMELALRFEVKADQLRNLRCTNEERQLAFSGCSAGFPTITPNPQYAIRTSGLIGQRLRVNVDFDSEREFDANNNLQVWYEGLEGEALRRVEAGNVTFEAPPSRFIGAAVPANNFGVQAVGRLGALELRGIYAQQKGNIVKDRTYTIGETTSQPLDREARDLDFEAGRFFFAVDPAAVPGFPAIDILTIEPALLPEPLRVGSLRVYRVRALAPASTSNQNIGGVRAVACAAGTGPGGPRGVDCARQRAGPFQWEILLEGRDYYVDPSGAWFALASRLDQSDYLAVSYVTALLGDSVGTFPAAARDDSAVVDTLRLIYDPRPGITGTHPSFRFEIRNAYRVGGSEILRETAELTLLVNRRERTLATGETYLAHLGLAMPSDRNRFDQYNRLFPRERDPQRGAPLRDYYVVFPHLTPLADSARLEPAERNDSLYRTPRTLLASQGPPSVFTLRLHASVSASPDRATLSLNGFQIREGSEKLYIGSRLLTRDLDYTIDYAAGQVQFRNADSLFPPGAAVVRAQFEERAAFIASPTSIYGLAATYDLGARGQLNVTGLFRREQTAFTRPPLGFEPASSFIGGVGAQLRFQPAWLARALGTATELALSAEVAVSKPSPNRHGQAYIEEFEGEAGRFLSLAEQSWHWGSRPCRDPGTGCGDGARGATAFGISPAGFDTANVTALTWQNLPYGRTGPIQFLPQQIDPLIRLAGQTQAAEQVLWLTLKPDTVLGLANTNPASPSFGRPNWVRPAQSAPRWRSITLALSATGVDLSRVEFLQFWLWEDNRRTARANGAAILFDFGSVFEDALALIPDSFTVTGSDTTFHGARFAGLGRLDTERDPRTRSWSATLNDEGVLTDRVIDGIRDATAGVTLDTLALCSATADGRFVPYALGDLRSRCGRRNGAVDTEDLDGDFQLDSLAGVRVGEDFVRYAFPIGDDRSHVRDGGMTPVPDSLGGGASGWRLYRIPFRTDTITVGQPNLRQVQSLRLTVVAPQTGTPDPELVFALARVRLVGSTWVKRAETPIRGLGGERGTGVGEVVASVVSTENEDLGYEPPPGVIDEAGRRDASFQIGTTQINERSLRLLARGLGTGERAEAFLRFTAEGDKNFLRYRRLRVWARGRGPGWEEGDLEFYIKVGKDADNFYLYRTLARTTTWEPEVVADFGRWLALRAAVERAWLRGDTAQVYAGCPDTTLVPFDSSYVMCDGPYLVHVRNPGTAPPNLASVQELAAGILRVAARTVVGEAELWVDDIRLSDVVEDAGFAGALDLSLSAAELGDLAVNISRRDGRFRQLGEDPSYVSDENASVAGTLQLGRLLPAGWGLAAPLTVRYGAAASDPFYLSRTDLRADGLVGLRAPKSRNASYTLSLRRRERAPAGLARWLLDPFGLSASYAAGDARSDLAQAKSSSYGLNLDYGLSPGAAVVSLAGLPVRLSPTALRLRSSLAGSAAARSTFQLPVAGPQDTLVVPARAHGKIWRNSATVDLAPASELRLRVDLASQRDLRDYGDSTTVGRLLQGERRTLLGRDVGFEAQRTVQTAASLTPRVAAWLRPRASLTSSFALTRDPNARQPVRELGDTGGVFRAPVAFSNARRTDVGAQLDVRALGRAVAGDSGTLALVLGRIAPVELSFSRARASTFARAPFVPSLEYQLGLGGLGAFRNVRGLVASSAVDNRTFTAAGGAALPLAIRLNANYQQSDGVTWVLRGAAQVPIHTRSRDWPSVTGTWNFRPPAGGVGRLLTDVSAQLSYRRRESGSEQGATVTRTVDRTLIPTVALTWARGVVVSLDAVRTESEQLAAGNRFRTERGQHNALVRFAFRPPLGLAAATSEMRAAARVSLTENRGCLRAAGQDACVPYVDSRQHQAQLTLDTDIPPNMTAGFQMAYILNEERQANRKVAQLVITAFVSLTTSLGQLR